MKSMIFSPTVNLNMKHSNSAALNIPKTFNSVSTATAHEPHMPRSPRQFLIFRCAMALLLGLVAISAADTFEFIQRVGPGVHTAGMGEGDELTNQAKPGDTIRVTFVPPRGYRIVTSRVEDPLKLGWKKEGDHVFSVVVLPNLSATRAHYADFYGTLARTATGSGTGGGIAGKDKPKPEDLTWDLRNHFKLLGAHQGVGDDLLRKPVGTLVSEKPAPAPVTEGEARWDKNTQNFIGSLREEGSDRPFVGQYLANVDFDSRTSTSMDAQPVETKPCPDGDKVPVTYVYLGVSLSGKIGGYARPDAIAINGFTANPSSTTAKQALDTANAKVAAANAAVAAAQQAKNVAQQAVAKAQTDLDAALAAVPAVKKAQTDLDNAKKKQATDQAICDKEKADFMANPKKGRYANLKPDPRTPNIDPAQTLYDVILKQCTTQLTIDAAAVAKAEADLTKAKAAAANDPKVKAAQVALDAAKAALAKADAAVVAAQAELAKATAAQKIAQADYDEAVMIEAEWKKAYGETLVHELGHRRIAHFYADKMTDFLNHFRAWGYAPTEARARVIAKNRFDNTYERIRKEMFKAQRDLQDLYDSAAGTDHGLRQDAWDWGRLK